MNILLHTTQHSQWYNMEQTWNLLQSLHICSMLTLKKIYLIKRFPNHSPVSDNHESTKGTYQLLTDCLLETHLNTLRPRQNGRHFANNLLKCIFLSENVWDTIKISLKFVPKGPIDNIPVLVQIMAWCWSGDKLLSETMMVSLLMHICVTRPQWVNISNQ